MIADARPRVGRTALRGVVARVRQPEVAALLAFVLALVAAFVLAVLVKYQWQEAAQLRFARHTAQISSLLRQELVTADAVLHGARALVETRPDVDGAQWQHYVASIDLDALHSPLNGVGYAIVRDGAPPMVARYAPAARANAPRVLPDDPATRAALRRATDSGEVALAAALTATRGAPAPTLALYLPVEADAAADSRPPAGYVFAPLDARRLFERLGIANAGIALTARAGNPPFVVYAGDANLEEAPPPTARFTSTDTVPFGGTTLSLDYSTNGSPSLTGAADAATTVLLGGVAGAAALAFLAYALARRAAAAPAQPDEARMMGIVRSSMEAIITVDESQRIVIFNPMAERVFGLSAMEAVGLPLSRFIPERFRAQHARHVERFGVTGVSERQMGRQQRVLYGLRANGDEFPIEASISQIRDASAKLYTVMLRDITERVRAEDSLKQSREELRELSANLQNVREAEKSRIARELHDDLGQQLTALKMDLSAVEHALDAPGREPQASAGEAARDEIATRLRGMRRLIDATVASVRRIAADLRPVMLDDLGLVPAIDWLANDFTNRYGIDVERHLDPGAATFSNAGATTLFRIVQEALTNVARHADATRVVLTLDIDAGCCTLRIVDNGRGSDRGADRVSDHDAGARQAPAGDGRADKSFGLLGIRERAHMLGGVVRIDTAPDEGFAIAVSFPLHALQPVETFP
ncbi:PAS domain-containing sensor histidine kinase [Paraburkholderia caballeronis]|uniref:PAS domain S-box-containing protein n=1 Tax=Paraburkholderia caballeronis TaxID=416943 RepID=A0A1H7P666_9BURK|nr:PAS domain-containing sensor histidine kinase [Paraburkholderia caballeronis]PXW25384.1 multi-sensor signal transduction histidine kinase [Paraburkholderia caballeronis]PXX00991.1 multi-sensor signal transduction histidine kinase [Paraburkholderia caballeronis]RAJ99656.1 multi-sensor signal transduction histidine kinase [Paraburkholderia caballeronis]SEE39568.1 multi-sensor signal transduction histidine kinase [Paraburkholderia caballeronis]SEL30735.1 PAS domain S-box-containing protein [Pa